MAANWPRIPALNSPEDIERPLPEGWVLDQIGNLYEQLPIGKRFDKKNSFSSGLVPVLDQSEDGIIGWHAEDPGVLASDEQPVVTFANHTCEMRWMQRPFSVIQNVFPLVGKSGVVDTRFLYYGTKGRVHLEEYKGHFPDYRRKWIAVPPLPEQHAIAKILGTLDDKIELNRRRNQTLEAMARALFQDWFVDFGPVRAKMEGREPYLPADFWQLFPTRLSADGTPEAWDKRPLDEIADFLNGLALQKFPATDPDDSLPVIKIAELRNGISTKSDRASRDVPAKYIVEDGDFLFSWSGSLVAKFWTEGEGALNQHLFKVTSKEHPMWFVSQWVHHHLEEFQFIAASKATTMGHIQRGHLSAAMTLVPPDDGLQEQSRLMKPLVERGIQNELENRTLTTLRDALLPKLLSGELRVNSIHNVIEEATS